MVQSENHAAVRRSGPLPSPPPPRSPTPRSAPCAGALRAARGASHLAGHRPSHVSSELTACRRAPRCTGPPARLPPVLPMQLTPWRQTATPTTLWHQPPPQSQHLCPAGTLLAFATRPEARARAPFPHVTCPPWQGRPPRSPAPRGVCRPTCLLPPLAELMNLRYSGKWDRRVVLACYSVLSEAVDTSSRLAVGLEFLSRGLYPAQRRLPVFRRLC